MGLTRYESVVCRRKAIIYPQEQRCTCLTYSGLTGPNTWCLDTSYVPVTQNEDMGLKIRFRSPQMPLLMS